MAASLFPKYGSSHLYLQKGFRYFTGLSRKMSYRKVRHVEKLMSPEMLLKSTVWTTKQFTVCPKGMGLVKSPGCP